MFTNRNFSLLPGTGQLAPEARFHGALPRLEGNVECRLRPHLSQNSNYDQNARDRLIGKGVGRGGEMREDRKEDSILMRDPLAETIITAIIISKFQLISSGLSSQLRSQVIFVGVLTFVIR
ncbi:hypothetical protein RUM43_006603 [Polyplax serrata]|uniref:Uncharacterized protein n=1 Tax=Polyplax serrata TaxID=468196 RepID=A0AAN8PBQ0_POLSC